MNSPYENRMVASWDAITQQLLNKHPLTEDEIVEIVLDAWDSIMQTKIGGKSSKYGKLLAHVNPRNSCRALSWYMEGRN